MARNKFTLLASTSLMSMAEASKGRLMRSPDEHPSQEQAPAEEAPKPTDVRDIGGGAREVVAEMPTTEEASEGEPAKEPLKLPEGFTDAESFAKAVLDGTYKPEPAAATEESDAPKGLTDEQLKEVTKGMAPEMAEKVAPFVKAFAETGTLTDEQVAEAAKATGMSEPMVRQYMAGAEAEGIKQQVADAAIISRFAAPFGGPEGYDAFTTWAKNGGLSEAEGATYDKMLEDNPDGAFALLTSFKERMESQGGGKAPRDLTRGGGSGAEGPGDVFGSVQEQNAAINDPRYGQDKAYTDAVRAKVQRTTL
jgi:hypothetical protein